MRTEAMDLIVRKSVTVEAAPEHAFSVFTDEIASWWPVETHSINKQTTPVFEGRAGGRLYERTEDGKEEHWARVLEWEPPHRLVLEWRVNPERPPTQIEITFTADGSATRVDLVHSGFDTEEFQGGYDEGWDVVIGRYEDRLAGG